MQDHSDRRYHHGDLRRAILETALGMLHEDRGWQFTLREVARRAGVSHAAPYKHFPDKAALLAEMALVGFDRLRETLTKATRRNPSTFRDKFFAIGRAYVWFGTANPALYRLMFSADSGKTMGLHLHERAVAAFNVLIELVQSGQADGVLRKRDARHQATACWAQVHGITMLTIDRLLPTGKVGSKTLDAALATLLEGLES